MPRFPANPRPTILLVNDDGRTPVFEATLHGLRRLNVEIIAVFPSKNHTGCAAAISMNRPIRLVQKHVAGVPAWTVSSFPADGVRYALRNLVPTAKVVISGINEGRNVGRMLVNSGTFGAASEGARAGCVGIALSAPRSASWNSTVWMGLAMRLVERIVLDAELISLAPFVLNINFPKVFRKRSPRAVLLPVSTVEYAEYYEQRRGTVILRGKEIVRDSAIPDLIHIDDGDAVVNVICPPWITRSAELNRRVRRLCSGTLE